MFGLGVQEIMLILLIAVFFFGGEKLPEIAKGLGKGVRELKRAMEEPPEGDKRQERAPVERTDSTNNVVK
jgi:sec-independent protein translocase protein TatA